MMRLNDERKGGSSSQSLISHDSSYALSEMLDSSNADEDSDSRETDSRTSQSYKDPPRLRFSSLNFMFPKERAAKRKEHASKQSSAYKKVSFATLAEFYVYDSSKNSFGETAGSWINFCPVYLITEHSFRCFEADFVGLSSQIYTNKDKAEDYWRRIMVKGAPQLRTVGDVDTELNHRSLLVRRANGVIPLLDDLKESDLKEPDADDLRRSQSSSSSIVSRDYTEEAANEGLLDEENDDDEDVNDLFKRLGPMQSQLTDRTESQDTSETKPSNVYLRFCKMDNEEMRSRMDRKLYEDLQGLQRFAQELGARFKIVVDKEVNRNSNARENTDIALLNQVEKHLSPGNDKMIFHDLLFKSLMARYITMRAKIKAFTDMKIAKHFRKAFASPVLCPESVNYKETVERGIKYIDEMLTMMEIEAKYMEHMENSIKQHVGGTPMFGQPISEEVELQMFGKIVCYKKDSDTCSDFFTGRDLKVKDKANIQRSNLIFKYVSKRRKKDGDKVDPWAKVAEVQDPPDIILPQYFSKLAPFMKDPLKKWNFIKTRFMEIFMCQINTGVITALLNGSQELLTFLETRPLSPVIEETSLLNAEGFYNLGQARGKESQRTMHLFNINRNKRNDLMHQYHFKYSYIDKNKAHENPLLSNNKTEVYVDALSAVLNPIVRADLYVSRKRHGCDAFCNGHRGILLATLIKLGRFDMIDLVATKGIKLNYPMCTGDVAQMRWDMGYESRVQELRKKQDEELKKLALEAEAQKKKKNPISRLMGSQKRLNIKSAEREKAAALSKQALTEEDAAKVLDAADLIQADEVEMVHRSTDKPDAQTVHEEEEMKEEKKAIMRQKSIRKAVAKTAPRKQSKSKPLFPELDHTAVLPARKKFLVSVYEKQTPLVIAVQCAVADIYDGRKTPSLEAISKLPNDERMRSERQAREEILEMEQRAQLVESLLRAKYDVLDCDGAALKACLPVVEHLAKAARAKAHRAQKKAQKIQRNWSHTNNQTMTPRDWKEISRRKSKISMMKERLSVTDRILAARKPVKMTSTQLLNFKKFEEESRSQYLKASTSKIDYEKQRRYAASMNGCRILQIVTDHAIHQINSKFRTASRKLKGQFASIMVRTLMVFQAVKESKWDVVRFMCPYTVNIDKSSEIAETNPDLDPYDVKWKEFDDVTGEVLKRVVRMLILEASNLLTPTYAWPLNGIYFIMKEYNVILSRGWMTDLLQIMQGALTLTVEPKAGTYAVLPKLFESPQLQHFLKVQKRKYLDDRILDTFALTKEAKQGTVAIVTKNKFSLSQYKDDMIRLTVGAGMSTGFDILKSTSLKSSGKDSYMLNLAFYVLIRKKETRSLPLIKSLFQYVGVEKSNERIIFEKMLSHSISESRGKSKAAEVDLILELLKYDVKPSQKDCVHFILKALATPLLDMEETYNGNDRCADLARYQVLDRMISALFYGDYSRKQNNTQLFNDIVGKIAEQLEKPEGSQVWLQGVDYLFQAAFNTCDGIDKLLEDEKSKTARVYNFLNEKMKWRMQYEDRQRMLVMTRLHEDPSPNVQEIDMEAMPELKPDVIEGHVSSPLL